MGWRTVKLGDVCSVERERFREGSLPYVGMEDIEGFTGRFLGDYIPRVVASSTFKFSGEHVLYGRLRPYLNKVLVPDFEGHCSSEIFPLKPTQKLDRKFLYYWLSSEATVNAIDKTCTGARMPRANVNEVLTFDFLLPQVSEQKRIVAILDEAFADIEQARAKTEQNLKNARELFESYLQQVFSQRGEGWVTSKLKDITSKIGSGATPRGGRAAYKEEGISLIRSLNIHDRSFREKNLAFIDDEQADKLSNVVVNSGDVLLNITGASVARCAVVPDDFLPARVNQHVSIIRPDQSILDSEFLSFILTSKHYKDQLLGIGETGATRQAITKSQIEAFEIDYPSCLEEQARLLSKLHEFEEQTSNVQASYNKKLKYLDELKQSILKKAFSGELTKKSSVEVAYD